MKNEKSPLSGSLACLCRVGAPHPRQTKLISAVQVLTQKLSKLQAFDGDVFRLRLLLFLLKKCSTIGLGMVSGFETTTLEVTMTIINVTTP